jgi:hypothetical protein
MTIILRQRRPGKKSRSDVGPVFDGGYVAGSSPAMTRSERSRKMTTDSEHCGVIQLLFKNRILCYTFLLVELDGRRGMGERVDKMTTFEQPAQLCRLA